MAIHNTGNDEERNSTQLVTSAPGAHRRMRDDGGSEAACMRAIASIVENVAFFLSIPAIVLV
jgi:hypothetical protein